MSTIAIRDVPEETMVELRLRAAREGRSMQEYLRRHLVDLCREPTLEAWLDEAQYRRQLTGSCVTTEEIQVARDAARR